MKRTKYIAAAISSVVLGTSLGFTALPGNAAPNATPRQLAQNDQEQNCQYLREVTTGKTSVRKQIQVRVLTGNNWNTDFAVPQGIPFRYFVGIMTPENDGMYDISGHMKFSDNTSSMIFSANRQLQRGRTYTLPFQSPTGQQPFQINARIGGANNNAYTISILGCR